MLPSVLTNCSNRKPDSPTLTWSSLQHLLETAIPHVLIILDCCYAANAARDTSEGTTKELLAACGRENPTLGVGIRSFTSAIVEELQAFGRSPFTVAMLHSRLITMRWRLAYTPVYALLSEHGGHSIELAPLSALTQTGKSSEEDDSGFDEDMMDITTPEALVATDTRVLLSVSISDDAACDIAEWKKWLVTQAPVEVTKVEVKVEAVFKSHSTMLIVSLPIMVWNCLPNKAAYRFVGFVKSGNLDQTHLDVERDNGRLAATVSNQQGENRLVKNQLQLFESRTLSTSEELSKERDAARDSLSEIQQSMKATKSNLLAQQEVAAQRQVLLERKEQEWANEKRTMEDKVRVAEERLAALLEHQSTKGKTSALAPKDMKEFPIDSRPMNVSKFHPKLESPKHTSIQARTLNSFEPLPPDIKASPKSGLLQSSHHGDSALQNFQNAESTAQAGSAMAGTLQTAGWPPPGSKDDFPIKTERTRSPLHDTSDIHDEATGENSPIEAKTTTPRPSIIFKEEQWTGAKPLQGEEFSEMNETKNDDIWFDKVVKEEAATSPANQLIYFPWSKEHVPTFLEISQKEKSTSGTFDFASSPQSTQWTHEMDLQLQQARQQGHNWATIAKSYFPSSTAMACRKRHEKVTENIRNEYTKFELLATLYAQLREYTWGKLALAAGEHWSVVEAKASHDLCRPNIVSC